MLPEIAEIVGYIRDFRLLPEISDYYQRFQITTRNFRLLPEISNYYQKFQITTRNFRLLHE